MDFTAEKRGFPNRDTKVLATINQKGGVGKSTTVINLAAALGNQKKKILVIDFDPQGNTTSGFGIEKEALGSDVYNVISEDLDIVETLVKPDSKGVYLVPSTVQLAGSEIELVGRKHREEILKNSLKGIKDEFDYVLIDCPPSLGLLTINALVAATHVLIPIQCEYYALEGVTKLLESMKMVQQKLNPNLETFGVLMTMFDSRTTLSKQVVDEVKSYFGSTMFKTIIPRNVKISEAPSHGIPVTEYARISKGAIAYNKLAKEVIRRG